MLPLSERTWYRAIACMLTMIAVVGVLFGIYPTLLPAMIEQGWLSKSQAGYVESAKSIGVLLGAFACTSIGKKYNLGIAARIFLLIGLVSLGLSAINFGPIWLGINRFAAGFSIAGAGMTAAALITQGAGSKHRGKIIALLALGAGFGTILMATTLPLPMIDIKVSAMNGWLYATLLFGLCVAIAWPGLRTRHGSLEFPDKKQSRSHHKRQLVVLTICYGTMCIAATPVFVYLSTYIHDEYKVTLAFSSMAYAIAGLGVALGGFVCNGIFVRLVGRYFSLILTLSMGLGAALLIIFSNILWVDLLASFLIAMTHSGCSTLRTHDILQLAGASGEVIWLKVVKVITSIAFAIGSFASGVLLAEGLGFDSLFIMSAITFSLALAASIFVTLPKSEHDATHDSTE